MNRKYSFNKLFIQYLVRNINSKFDSKIEGKPIQIYVIFKPWVKACKKRKRERYLRTWGLQGTFLTYWVPIYHILGSFMWEKKSQITPKLPSFKIFDSFNFYWQNNDSKKIHSKKCLIIHSTEIFIQIKNWLFIQKNIHSKKNLIIHSMKIFIFWKSAVSLTPTTAQLYTVHCSVFPLDRARWDISHNFATVLPFNFCPTSLGRGGNLEN